MLPDLDSSHPEQGMNGDIEKTWLGQGLGIMSNPGTRLSSSPEASLSRDKEEGVRGNRHFSILLLPEMGRVESSGNNAQLSISGTSTPFPHCPPFSSRISQERSFSSSYLEGVPNPPAPGPIPSFSSPSPFQFPISQFSSVSFSSG